jgi:alpha-L-fucosidase
LYKQFNPTKFNADEWVSLAKATGMKYIVLTTKHHDGFCLFDTKLTDYNIMNTPFHRDVTKELAEACKKQGIAFGAYYSVCDWHNPDFPLTSPAGKTKRDKSDIDAYQKYLLGQVNELVTNYGPLVTIWNDVPQQFKGRGVDEIKLLRELQPDILINDRTGDGGDYATPEQKIPAFNMSKPWESCMTISAHNHWAWGGENDGVKPLSAVVEMLVNCATRDGNMLLNVGPEPTGVINDKQTARLKDMGEWVRTNGESIYGTRGGPWMPTKSVGTTRKDNVVYVHVLNWSADSIKLPAIGKTILSSSLLGGGGVKVDQAGKDSEITITVAPGDRKDIDTIVKLTLDGSAMDISPVPAGP